MSCRSTPGWPTNSSSAIRRCRNSRPNGGTQDALAQEVRNAVSNLNEQYQASLEREKTLDQELEKQKSFALGLNDAAVRYLILEREADANRELYNSVLKRLKDMALLADAHASNISIVDKAEPPRFPSSPKVARDLLQATLFALVAAFGLAFLAEHLDTTLKFPDDAERYLRLPNLAAIPDFAFAGAALSVEESPRNDRALQAPSNRSSSDHSCDVVTTFGKRRWWANHTQRFEQLCCSQKPGLIRK